MPVGPSQSEKTRKPARQKQVEKVLNGTRFLTPCMLALNKAPRKKSPGSFIHHCHPVQEWQNRLSATRWDCKRNAKLHLLNFTI